MAAVVAAHDGLLFLVAWEIMALSPFFLVIFDDRRAAVRHAAWTYLAATHLGTAFLLVLFVLLGELAGSSDFASYPAALNDNPALCSLAFLLALVGFGAKAGDRSGACLAAGSTPGRAEPCLGADVGRDDQGRHLRPAPRLDAARHAASRGGAGC